MDEVKIQYSTRLNTGIIWCDLHTVEPYGYHSAIDTTRTILLLVLKPPAARQHAHLQFVPVLSRNDAQQ